MGCDALLRETGGDQRVAVGVASPTRRARGVSSALGRLGLAAALFAAAPALLVRAEDEPIVRSAQFRADVDASVKRGVRWLLAQQRRDGQFRDHDQFYADTAYAMHALRACGVPADDAAQQRAADALLRGMRVITSYSAPPVFEASYYCHDLGPACMTLSWRAPAPAAQGAPPTGERRSLERMVDSLVELQPSAGYWPTRSDRDSRGDVSLNDTFFAILALSAGRRAGCAVPGSAWSRTLGRVQREQDPRGAAVKDGSDPKLRVRARGWNGYESPGTRGFRASAEGTARALTVLATCRTEWAADPKARLPADAAYERALRDGIAFLATQDLPVFDTESDAPSELPYWEAHAWACAGNALGAEHIAQYDWYGELAFRLCVAQGKSGGWCENRGSTEEWSDFAQGKAVKMTSLALLVLTSEFHPPAALPDGADFAGAPALSEPAFAEFVEGVAETWTKSQDDAARSRLLERTTALGPRIVPVLIELLSSDAAPRRAAAIAFLKHATGLDHGFSADGEVLERQTAATRWAKWWEAHRTKLRFDAESGRLVD